MKMTEMTQEKKVIPVKTKPISEFVSKNLDK